jgi:hypothetical protein
VFYCRFLSLSLYLDKSIRLKISNRGKKSCKNTPLVLSTHIPLFSIYGQMKDGPTSAMGEGSVVTNALDVMKIFEGYNLKLVLQGHLHIVEEIRYAGTTFVTGGAVCGAWWKGARDGFPERFVVVDVKADKFDWEYKTFGWQAEIN